MAGRGYPLRMGEVEKKKLTPKRKKKGKLEGPKVVRGDVLILRGPYNHSSIGVVMTPSTHGGPHRLVDEHGKDREVYKRHPEAAPSPFSEAYDGKIVVVGHDEEWVRFEEDVCRRRQELSRSHQTAAWRHIVEARREEQEDG